MRACMLFVTGLLVGVGLHSVAAQSGDKGPNTGLVAMNHVAMQVPNFNETLDYYTKTLGFPEAFVVRNDDGTPRLAYVQISKNTFVEIQPGMPGAPAGGIGARIKRYRLERNESDRVEGEDWKDYKVVDVRAGAFFASCVA